MKRVKYNNLIYGFVIAAFAFAGCSKELDVNKDPNRVTDDNVTPELIFTQAEQAVGALPVNGYGFLQNWVGYFAPNGDFAPNQVEQTYNIDFGFGDPLWQNSYNVLFDLYKAKTKALDQQNTMLAGAAMILSAKMFQELIDLYGDLPYKEAFQSDIYSNPKYDNAKDVYNELLSSLDTAVGYVNISSDDVPNSFKSADIINSGNPVLWTKFANTLRLRLLIRQSEVSGFDPSSVVSKIQNTGGVLEAGDNIDVNPGYLNDVNKQSPFFAAFGYDPTGNIANTATNANSYIVNILTTSSDPRIGRFFQDLGGNYVGNVYGDATGDLTNGANTSYFGPGLLGEDPASGSGASQAQWIYPAYESLFLKAEAIARGWLPGNTQSAYEAAVTESFVWLKVPDAVSEANNYLESADIANWDNAGSSVSSQVNFIAYQKYIANTGVDPLESYSDERRLHFLPDGFVSTNPARVANTLPLRLLYAQSEYTTNNASVQAVGNINAYSTKIFWEP